LRKNYEANATSEDNTYSIVKTLGDSVYPPFSFVNGVAELPSDYLSKSSLTYIKQTQGDCDTGPTIKTIPVEWVPDNIWDERQSSLLTPPTMRYPIWTIQNGKAIIAPKKIKNTKFTYFRKLNSPYMDYTLNGLEVVYLPPTSTHDGSVLASGTASRTVEPEFNNYTKFGQYVLMSLGIMKRSQEIVQLAATNMNQNKQQEANA
jgi:hypothetical protein